MRRRALPKGRFHFPRSGDVFRAFVIEALDPVAQTSVNEIGAFSSKALTNWYVSEFCKLNNLKEVK